jgi:hypothetical protein
VLQSKPSLRDRANKLANELQAFVEERESTWHPLIEKSPTTSEQIQAEQALNSPMGKRATNYKTEDGLSPTSVKNINATAEPLSFVTVGANYDLHAAQSAARDSGTKYHHLYPRKLTIATQMVRVDRQTGLLRIPPAL